MVPGKPLAVISGGDERHLPANQKTVVSGADSINVDCLQGGDCSLEYKWTCTVTQDIKFCDRQLPNGL